MKMILKKRRTEFSLLFLMLLGFAGCSSNGGASPTPAEDAVRSPGLVGTRWEWVNLTTPVEQIDIGAPERYTIEFAADGAVAGLADCNRYFGRYSADGHQIRITGLGATKMLCPQGSHFDRYLRDLGQVAVFSFLEGGDLILELPVDSGTLRFRAE